MSGGERAIAVRVTGRVQGVNFRNHVKEQAERLGVGGWVVNRDDGSLEAVFSGAGEALAKMIEICRAGPPAAQVDNLDLRSTDAGHGAAPPQGAYTF